MWKHRWKIVAISPFAIALATITYYTGYRIHAERLHKTFTESWQKKGESLDIDQLIPEQRIYDQSDDFFSHPAIIAETKKHHSKNLASLARSEIKGLSSSLPDYFNPRGNGAYVTGHQLDIRLWLDPIDKSITEQEAARHILILMHSMTSRLDGIVQASHRKHAWYPRDFDSNMMPKMGSTTMRFSVTKAPKILGERALLHLISGEEAKARADYLAAIRIAKLCSQDNNLVGYLIGSATLQALETTLWEGLARQLWSEESLAQFEHLFKDINEEERFLKNMRQEVAYTNHLIHKIHEDPSFAEKQQKTISGFFGTTKKDWKDHAKDAWLKIRPRGWYLKNGTKTLNIFDEIIFYPEGTKAQHLSMTMVESLNTIPYPLYSDSLEILTDGNMTMDIYGYQIVKALKTQAIINNMRTAIALERYRQKNNNYPEQLSQLVPHYLPTVLIDVITRKPLTYRIKSDGTPLIYSIGANQKNDDGKPNIDPNNGDWAWMYSPPSGFKWSDYTTR